MSSTTPSATRNSASFDRLHVEKGRPWSTGLDSAILLISRRSGSVNVGGRPPEYFGSNEAKPSSLKLCRTSRTRSGDVKATLAIWATSMACADSRTIWARRHRTTDPEDRRMIRSNRLPSSLSSSRTLIPLAHANLLSDNSVIQEIRDCSRGSCSGGEGSLTRH